MLIFVDEEFTGLYKDADLISIGAIAANGRSFYAEITDFKRDRVNDWIQEHVIKNLVGRDAGADVTIIDTKAEVSRAFVDWLGSFGEDIQFVSDVCHYDFVFLIDLITDCALDLPQYISPAIIDINQKIAYLFKITARQAFDMNREKLACVTENTNSKHNALFDAKCIKKIWELGNFKEGKEGTVWK